MPGLIARLALSSRDGLRVEPRAATAWLLLLILAISATPTSAWNQFLSYFLLIQLAALGAGVSAPRLWLRATLVVPFCLAALPLLFTRPGLVLTTLPWLGWTVSAEGLAEFLSIALRGFLCIQVLLLTSSVVPIFSLVDGFSGLGLPARLVAILRLCLTYFDLLYEETLRLRRARACRSQGRGPGLLFELKMTGQMVGVLFLRTLDRAQRVSQAMICRGYDPASPCLRRCLSPWQKGDYLLLSATCLAISATVVLL